jgi:hypothetical protein
MIIIPISDVTIRGSLFVDLSCRIWIAPQLDRVRQIEKVDFLGC